jgi:MFS-type transporter involved in bile tolerance (Atg22 family)
MLIGVGIATFISPIYAGHVFDLTESYATVLISFSVLLLFPAFLFSLLRKHAPRKKPVHSLSS